MIPGVKAVELPPDLVIALFDFAGRNLSKEEWAYLKKWESTIQQGMMNAQRQHDEKNSANAKGKVKETNVKPEPPFDPTSDAAAKKRQMRADKRAAVEARNRLKTVPEGGDTVDGTTST